MKPVILLAIANDHLNKARYLRELNQEAKEIQQAFAASGSLCEFLPPLVDASFEEIRGVFQKYRDRVAIFHFAGHANGLKLFLQSNSGSGEAVRATRLAEFLANQNNLQLVFLNGCSTGPQVDHFLNAGVSAVISTNQLINDSVARGFAAEFYRSLALGGSIRIAYREAVATSKPNHSDSPRMSQRQS